LMRNFSTRSPALTLAASQRGLRPRPLQVCEGSSGLAGCDLATLAAASAKKIAEFETGLGGNRLKLLPQLGAAALFLR